MNLITTIRGRYKFFRQPNKVGEVLDYDNKLFLIIGIQRFKVWSDSIHIWYTCQDLSVTDYDSRYYSEPGRVEVVSRIKYDDERIERLALGTVYYIQGQNYQLTEYTDITLDGTDLVISILAKIIYPIDNKQARAKYLSERKGKLKLEVF